jgi:vacuolar-type H+-ATPase subunit H
VISLRDFLWRLRRAWAPPGPALERVAPPTDVRARLKKEIQPVLDAIAELQRSAEQVRTGAREEASEMIEEATRLADGKVREAEISAPEARAAAAKRRHESVYEEIDRVLEASEAEAARIAERTRDRLPEMVDRVTACVLSGAGIDA